MQLDRFFQSSVEGNSSQEPNYEQVLSGRQLGERLIEQISALVADPNRVWTQASVYNDVSLAHTLLDNSSKVLIWKAEGIIGKTLHLNTLLSW